MKNKSNCSWFQFDSNVACIDLFMKRHELVHDGGFPKFEVLCYSQNTATSTKNQ